MALSPQRAVGALHLACLFFFLGGSLYGQTVELTKATADEFAAAKSNQMTIYGLRLGMRRAEADALLHKLPHLIAWQDQRRPTRLYVAERSDDGSRGEELLYLIWQPGKDAMERITVFGGCRAHLPPDLARLLTFEAFSDWTGFSQKMLGQVDRHEVENIVLSVPWRNHHYFYDHKGVIVTRLGRDGEKEIVVLGLVPPIAPAQQAAK